MFVSALDGAKGRLRGLWRASARRLYIGAASERATVAAFRRRYEGSDISFQWMGGAMATCPLDLWVYQEIVHEIGPELVIATTASARYLAAICQLTNRGEVVWIGSGSGLAGAQPRLRAVAEPPLSAVALAEVLALAAGKTRVLVVLGPGPDGTPSSEELRRYGPLVTAGSFLIVEGSTPALDAPGGAESVLEEFLGENPSFVVDASKEKLYLTFNRNGYLRRVAAQPPPKQRASADR